MQTGRLDLLAAHTLAKALYADAFDQAARRPGSADNPNGGCWVVHAVAARSA